MNAVLNINVRVAARQGSQALRQIEGDVKRLQQVGGRSSAAMGGMFSGAGMARLEKFGKNLQWTGRQLEFNFTLPLIAAGFAATKWALDNDRAVTGVRKVYGDLSYTTARVNAEVGALTKTFELLSSRFGVHQSEVIKIAESWAQAGAAGVGLAKATRLTLETMILGEMDAAQATQGLIAIQATFRLNTDQLRQVIEKLNIVENQTSISMEGLVQVLQRAGGVARTAGVSIEELSAMAAALVPATGSASQAGNGLRTMISRIMKPTEEAANLFQKMGINVLSAGWQSQDAMGRIRTLSTAFVGLSDAQKTTVAATAASLWQINRFDVLMEQVAEHTNGAAGAGNQFARGLDAANNAVAAHRVYLQELDRVLSSDSRQFAILTTVLKNTLTQAIQPVLPYLIMFLQRLARLGMAFADLSPQTKKFIVFALLLLAAIGPITRYMGAWALLVSTTGKFIMWLIPLIFGKTVAVEADTVAVVTNTVATDANTVAMVRQGGVMAALSGIWLRMKDIASTVALALMYAGDAIKIVLGRIVSVAAVGLRPLIGIMGRGATMAAQAFIAPFAAIAAAVGLPVWAVVAIVAAVLAAIALLLQRFYDGGIRGFVEDVGRAFMALPRIIASAFMAVVRVVAAAIKQIIEWLSYLNPFARHSPSLVDNVTAGVAAILNQYSHLAYIVPMLGRARQALLAFNAATGGLRTKLEMAAFEQDLADIAKIVPEAVGPMRALKLAIEALRPTLMAIQNQIAAQEAIVKGWELALRAADDRIDVMRDSLEALRDAASAVQDELQATQERLDNWSSTPIEGMGAMSDAIFENEMAQKRLRLEMMRLEETTGPIEDVRNQLALLEGSIETLRGTETELRMAGAGSEVLGPIRSQIAAMEEARRQLEGQDQGTTGGGPLEEMKRQLEELERQGEMLDLENAIKFDPLTRQIEAANNAMQEMPFNTILNGIRTEQAEVTRLTAAYDQANAAVKNQELNLKAAETARNAIQASYDAEQQKLSDLKDAYSAVEDQIRDMESALQDMMSAANQAKEAADKAKEPKFSEKLFDAGAGFDFEDVGGASGIVPEGGLEEIEAFNKEMEKELARAIKEMGGGSMFQPFKDMWSGAWDWIKTHGVQIGVTAVTGAALLIFTALGGWAVALIAIVAGALSRPIWEGIKIAWHWVQDQLWPFLTDLFVGIGSFFATLWGPVGSALKVIWESVIKPIWDAIYSMASAILVPIFKLLASVWEAVWGAIGGVLTAIWQGVISIVWGAIQLGIQTLIDIFHHWQNVAGEVWDFIGKAISWAWENVIKPVFNFIVSFIKAYLELEFKILQTLVEVVWNAIGAVIKWVWETIVKPIWAAIKAFIDTVLVPVFNVLKTVFTTVWNAIGSVAKSTWEISIKPIWGAIKTFIDNVLNPAWQSAKDVFSTVWNGIATIAETVWTRIKTAFSAGLSVIGKAVSGMAGIVSGIARVVGATTLADKLMAFKNDAWNWGTGLASGGMVRTKAFARGSAPPQDMGVMPYAKVGSGFITPGARAIVGEGNPNYPEYVIPTDPRYKSRALKLTYGLMNQLGLGYANGGVMRPTPGWYLGEGIVGGIKDKAGDIWDATGGKVVTAAGDVVSWARGKVGDAVAKIWKVIKMIGAIPNDFAGGMLNSIRDRAIEFIKGKETEKIASEGGGGIGASGPAPPGSVRTWLVQGLAIAGQAANWIDGMYRLAMAESGGNPRAVNKTAVMGQHATGLMQMLPSTFRANMVGGYGDIWNPVDNSGSASRYISRRYGSVYNTPFFKGGPYKGYSMGGLLPGADIGQVITSATSRMQSILRDSTTWKRFEDTMNRVAGVQQRVTSIFDSRLNGIFTGPGTGTHGDDDDPRWGYDDPPSHGGRGWSGMGRNRFDEDWDQQNRYRGSYSGNIRDLHRASVQADEMRAGGVTTYLRIPHLANGAKVFARSGGTLALLGEGRHDEAVVPLTPDVLGGDGGRQLHFHGDLSFPNIKSGADAETLVKNLEALA